MTVANIIVSQIGRQALYMIGAKGLVGHENGLSFKVGRNAKGVSHIRVTLEPNDTYTVEYLRIRKVRNTLSEYKTTVLASDSEVYVDDLHDSIETNIGLYTHL